MKSLFEEREIYEYCFDNYRMSTKRKQRRTRNVSFFSISLSRSLSNVQRDIEYSFFINRICNHFLDQITNTHTHRIRLIIELLQMSSDRSTRVSLYKSMSRIGFPKTKKKPREFFSRRYQFRSKLLNQLVQ